LAAPKAIEELIDKFDSDPAFYRSTYFNETEVRTQFINPFFEALGWDVYHKCKPDYRDVKEEDAVEVEGKTKNPDYSFRLSEKRKFFVEVKRPSINIESGVYPAYQIRSYAWSADLPISILTDFEEFSVYYCRSRPFRNDKPTKSRLLYFRYDQYAEKWPEIAALFSRDAVLNGSLDKYVGSLPQKRGDKRVDAALLEDISEWREMLAKNIALHNPGLDTMSLNYSVQAIIDRIMFLRICEDRGIEQYMRLKNLLTGERVYPRLCELFLQADERYNSGIFHFKKEPGRDSPDIITPNLRIDDKTLQDIIKHLYFPESPYAFSVLPAEILGQIYEQFLGKVIRLDESHNAWVEDKPEVKKAGGVQYTPVYIVENIVGNTLGKMLKGKTPLEVVLITVLDPACGSGSFLIVAYQYLLDWHRDWYVQNLVPLLQSGLKLSSPEIRRLLPSVETGKKGRKKEPELPIYQGRDGEWKLTTAERKRILLNNIYGVDIDRQAVEVTKLSLLLKVLEGENEETISKQLTLFQERALPDLSNNIKCGNSLIGWDILKDNPGLTQEEIDRINPFDWEKEFPGVISRGGFNVIIGNPPYVDIKSLPKQEVKYIFLKYHTANNRINLFGAFIEKSFGLLMPSQFRVSMIVPTAILTQDSYQLLRRKIIAEYHVYNVVRLPNESFGVSAGDVKVDTVIIVLGEKNPSESKVEIISYDGYDRISQIDPTSAKVYSEIEQSTWLASDDCVWSLNRSLAQDTILRKCECIGVPLEDCTEISLGLTPYDKYKGHTAEQIKNRVFHADFQKDSTFKMLLAGNDVMRYLIQWNGTQWISYGPWLGAPRGHRFFTDKRILVKQIIDWTTKRIWACITEDEVYNTQNAFNLLARPGWSLEYLLGILNSRLMTFYHQKKFLDEFKMRFQKILIKDCRRFPIRPINSSNPDDVARHDRMVSLVNQMLSLHKQLKEARTPHEQTGLQRQMEATDGQIDALVYELYGLTEEEIRIVEGT
jgi:hypothetical protein